MPTSAGSRPDAPTRRAEVLAAAAGLFSQYGYAQTSVRQIGDAAGILSGSLYHHFDSKESIAAELVELLRADLARVALRCADEPGGDVDVLRRLARQTAAVAERHLAAVELCTFEAPMTASVLGDALRDPFPGDEATWLRLVGRAAEEDRLCRDVDRPVLARILSQGAWAAGPVAPPGSGAALAEVLADVVLSGLVTDRRRAPDLRPAMVAVIDDVQRSWTAAREGGTGAALRSRVLDAARDAFGARGFEAATMRDVARGAGVGVASLYRSFPSKAEILHEIVAGFSAPLLRGFRDVVAVASGAVEALDGLVELMTRAGRTSYREYGIVRTWWRLVARDAPDVGLVDQRERLSLLRGVLADGIADGILRGGTDVDLLALAVRELLWLPFHRTAVDASRLRGLLRRTVVGGGVAVPHPN